MRGAGGVVGRHRYFVLVWGADRHAVKQGGLGDRGHSDGHDWFAAASRGGQGAAFARGAVGAVGSGLGLVLGGITAAAE